jgi:hypothetical protein
MVLPNFQEIASGIACLNSLNDAQVQRAILFYLININANGGSGGGGAGTLTGIGNPNGVTNGSPGQIYIDLTNPSSPVLYIKGSGTGNTGWV